MQKAIQKAKLFKNGQSQAVRLPKEFRFKGDEVFISRVGESIILTPTVNPWNAMIRSLDEFTPDFLKARSQPPQQKRRKIFE